MSFNPQEPRLPAGGAGGGQWGAGGAPSKKAPAKAPVKGANPAAKKSTPTGGPARNAAAAKAQADPQAQALYANLMATPPSKRGGYVQGLSDSDLQALTAIAYSSRTSDPKIVAARIAVANEMGKRGIDIKQHGALGGGPQAKPSGTTRKAPANLPRRVVKAPAKAAPAAAVAKKPAPGLVRPNRTPKNA